MSRCHTIPPDTPRTRLSDYLIGVFPETSTRNAAKKAIKKGLVSVNGDAAETGTWVEGGMIIELQAANDTPPKAFQLELEIVFEDDYLAVVNKPAGIAVSGNKFRTVRNALQHNLKQSELDDALPWPEPVHRLDTPTSGLLIAAKTRKAITKLGDMFAERKIAKIYRAVVQGKTPNEGCIDTPIDGQSAITEFETERTVKSLKNDYLSLVKLQPKTGRTHQIRIHLSSIGHPLVGDKQYGKEGDVFLEKGLFLAAVGLSFPHPVTAEQLSLETPTPDKFQSLLDREQRRWDRYNSGS